MAAKAAALAADGSGSMPEFCTANGPATGCVDAACNAACNILAACIILAALDELPALLLCGTLEAHVAPG